MPIFTRGEVAIHYEERGSGYPVLLLAPGGMRSSIPFWDRMPYHPVREFEGQFRLVAVDQRNAGQSRAPVHASDDWQTYASDHLALLDHLGIEGFHLLGACIVGSLGLALIAASPRRVTAAVLQQPIGLAGENHVLFSKLFDSWAEELTSSRADVAPAALAGLKTNLFGGDFVFSVSRDQVRACPVPLLILQGSDAYHPREISEEIARLAPRVEMVPRWKEGDEIAPAVARVRAFYAAHAVPEAARAP